MNKSSKLNLSKYISHPKLPIAKLNIKNRKLNNYINNAVILNTDFSYKTTNLRKQWNNNIYTYNTNRNVNIPQQDKLIDNLITNYFKLYNKQVEKKANIKYIVPKYKNRLIYNIFVDVSSVKHTNDNVIITLFTYNRSNKYILNKLNKLDFTHNARFVNNKSDNKNSALSNYKINKNILVKSLYNDMLCNNNLQYNYKTNLKNNITQGFNNKTNKTCLLTTINNNQEKHMVCKKSKLIEIPKYVFGKFKKFSAVRNIKISEKVFSIYRLEQSLEKKQKIQKNKINLLNTIQYKNQRNQKNQKRYKKFKNHVNKTFYMYKLKKIYKKKQRNINKKYKNIRSDFFYKKCISKFEFIKSELNLLKYIKQSLKLIKTTQFIKDNKSINKISNVSSRSLINIYNIYKLYNTTNKKNFIINQLQKKLVIYYKQMLTINKFKFENIYLTRLKLLLSKIYKKNIKFNIINLKYPSLNSNIYSQIICFKAKSRKFAVRTIFNWALNNLRLKRTVKFLYENKNMEFNKFKNVNLNKKDRLNKDLLTSNIDHILYMNSDKNNNIENFVFSCLKNKFLKGVKLQAKGRLTKRLTASRSVFKYGQKGSIRNYQSSYTGLYGYLLRGHIDSNVQYTKLESKNRNGAFGLKGWFSSM